MTNNTEWTGRITALSTAGRAAFAYACARRVFPIYRARFGESEIANEALERLRMFAGGLDGASDGARALVTALTEELERDASDVPTRAATQAAVALASAVETLYLDSVKGAESARSFALDAIGIVAPDAVDTEEEVFDSMMGAIEKIDPEIDLGVLDALPQPVWLSAVSPGGPLIGQRG